MKYKYLSITNFVFVIILMAMIACEKNDFLQPKVNFDLVIEDSVTKKEIILQEPYTLKAGQIAIYKDKSIANNIVIWLGDAKHNFDEMGQNLDSKGFTIDVGGDRVIQYTEPGIYTFVAIATSYDYSTSKYAEEIIKRQIQVNP